MPTFNQKILDSFVDIFSEQSQVFAEQMVRLAGKGEFDVFEALSKCTLDIICGEHRAWKATVGDSVLTNFFFLETAMGVKVNAQTNNDASVSTWIDR